MKEGEWEGEANRTGSNLAQAFLEVQWRWRRVLHDGFGEWYVLGQMARSECAGESTMKRALLTSQRGTRTRGGAVS